MGQPALLRRADGALIGFGGFKGAPRDGDVEIGYAVAPDRQGRGIATAVVGDPHRAGHRRRRHDRQRPHARRRQPVDGGAAQERLPAGRRARRSRGRPDLAVGAGAGRHHCMTAIRHRDVLRFRFHRHQLDRPPDAARSALDVDLLDYGVQDTGPDGSAWALAIRGAPAGLAAASIDPPTALVLAWTLRGAPHAYRRATWPRWRRRRRRGPRPMPRSGSSTPRRRCGAADIDVLDAPADVAATMRTIVTAPRRRARSSSRLSDELGEPYVRNCRACDATHIYEKPFRLAALQAGLVLQPGTSPPVLERVKGCGRPCLPRTWPRTPTPGSMSSATTSASSDRPVRRTSPRTSTAPRRRSQRPLAEDDVAVVRSTASSGRCSPTTSRSSPVRSVERRRPHARPVRPLPPAARPASCWRPRRRGARSSGRRSAAPARWSSRARSSAPGGRAPDGDRRLQVTPWRLGDLPRSAPRSTSWPTGWPRSGTPLDAAHPLTEVERNRNSPASIGATDPKSGPPRA